MNISCIVVVKSRFSMKHWAGTRVITVTSGLIDLTCLRCLALRNPVLAISRDPCPSLECVIWRAVADCGALWREQLRNNSSFRPGLVPHLRTPRSKKETWPIEQASQAYQGLLANHSSVFPPISREIHNIIMIQRLSDLYFVLLKTP